MPGAQFEADQFGVPPHGHSLPAEQFAEQLLVVVLPEDQHERIRAQLAADVAERYADRGPSARCPEVHADRRPAEFDRPASQA